MLTYFQLFKELALAIIWMATPQIHCLKQTVQDPILSAQATNMGIDLIWTINPSWEVESIQIYRARNAEPLKLFKELKTNKGHFNDSLAIFGLYNYQLKIETQQGVFWSNNASEEFYLGNDFFELYPSGGVTAGESFNLVFGNAQKNDSIWFALLNADGDYIKGFSKKPLDGQKFILQTTALNAGVYLAFFKLEDFSVFTYKFSVK